MKTILLFLFFFMSYFPLLGQGLDSLEEEKVDAYLLSSKKAYIQGDLEQALLYLDTLYTCSKELNYIRGILVYYSFKGYILNKQGYTDLALKECYQALELIDSTGYNNNEILASIYEKLCMLYHNQGVEDSAMVYADKIMAFSCQKDVLTSNMYIIRYLEESGNIKKAIELCEQSIVCAKEVDASDNVQTFLLQAMGMLQGEIENHEIAIKYMEECLHISEMAGDSMAIIRAYDQLGEEHSAMSNFDEALVWYKKALGIGLSNSSRNLVSKKKKGVFIIMPIAIVYDHLAKCYAELSHLDSAIYCINKGLIESYKRKDSHNVVVELITFAHIMMKDKKYKVAIDSLEKAYDIAAQNVNWSKIQFDVHCLRGRCYQELGKMDAAEENLKKAETFAEKLNFNKQYVSIYGALEQLYLEKKNYKKSYEYRLLKNKYNDKIRNQENRNAILRFEIKYESEKLKTTNLELAKNQEIQAKEIAFAKALNTRNKSIIIVLIILISLLLGIAWLIYQQKKIQHRFRIMELEQKALKAQINPHFFFNVLNSLQATILSEKPKVAYKYHSKFTKLMRLILMQSNSDGISLAEELEALKLYLELEQLRTGDAFDFEIINESDFEEEPIVPSMLLQPFVENSIWHGVMNRADGEKKKITIHIHKKNNRIVCEIEDTGVGREQAQQIKQQKTKQYESMGIEVTQNRLELFQLRYKTPLRFSIQDIKNMKNQVLGTKVDLEIPIISK